MCDILGNSSARIARDRRIRYLIEQGEFDIPRHDGTYKMLMGMTHSPKHGSPVRKYEGQSGLLGRKDRLHVAHTLTTASGSAITASAAFSESREISLDVVKRGVSASDGIASYAGHVRVLYTDRPRDFDHEDTWGVLPGLVAIACDPLHRCLEIESCSGGKITKLSDIL